MAAQTNSKGTEQAAAAAMTPEQMAEMIARLTAENAQLAAKAAARGSTSLKVSDKGAVSVYGLGRFPTTLYPEQMLRLLDMADAIKAFIEANKASLSFKAPRA